MQNYNLCIFLKELFDSDVKPSRKSNSMELQPNNNNKSINNGYLSNNYNSNHNNNQDEDASDRSAIWMNSDESINFESSNQNQNNDEYEE